jgi:hypothetical protein
MLVPLLSLTSSMDVFEIILIEAEGNFECEVKLSKCLYVYETTTETSTSRPTSSPISRSLDSLTLCSLYCRLPAFRLFVLFLTAVMSNVVIMKILVRREKWEYSRTVKYLCQEFYFPGYNAVWFVESQLMFGRNMSSPSSGSKNKPSN